MAGRNLAFGPGGSIFLRKRDSGVWSLIVTQRMLGASTASWATFTAPISGGIVSGGAASWARARSGQASGGLVSGGASNVTRLSSRTYSPSGGLVSSGSATVARRVVRNATVSGGIVSAGAAQVAGTQDVSPLGGLIAGGSASITRGRAYKGVGGLQSGGAGLVARVRTVSGAGGAYSGGAALVSRSRALFGTGGFSSNGSAAINYFAAGQGQAFTFVASGGASVSGFAATSYVGASVPIQIANSGTFVSRSPPNTSTVYQYQASGGMAFGGIAETRLVLGPLSAWEFAGAGIARIGGAARTERHDPFAQARAEDEELILLG